MAMPKNLIPLRDEIHGIIKKPKTLCFIDPHTDDIHTVVRKVEVLSEQIKDLRARIQGILEIALKLSTTWHTMEDLSEDAKGFAEQLIRESTLWTSELANRYTFLLNLKDWLSLHGASAEELALGSDEQHRDSPSPA